MALLRGVVEGPARRTPSPDGPYLSREAADVPVAANRDDAHAFRIEVAALPPREPVTAAPTPGASTSTIERSSASAIPPPTLRPQVLPIRRIGDDADVGAVHPAEQPHDDRGADLVERPYAVFSRSPLFRTRTGPPLYHAPPINWSHSVATVRRPLGTPILMCQACVGFTISDLHPKDLAKPCAPTTGGH